MIILNHMLSIKTQAINHGLSPSLLAAICMAESAGDPWSMRFEPKWMYFLLTEEFARKSRISNDTERTAQAFSYGLCHVMGSVVRQHSLEELSLGEIPLLSPHDPLSKLFDPNVNLHYASRHLKKFLDRHDGSELDACASYNAGSPRRKEDGTYMNQHYVDTVMQFKRELLELD